MPIRKRCSHVKNIYTWAWSLCTEFIPQKVCPLLRHVTTMHEPRKYFEMGWLVNLHVWFVRFGIINMNTQLCDYTIMCSLLLSTYVTAKYTLGVFYPRKIQRLILSAAYPSCNSLVNGLELIELLSHFKSLLKKVVTNPFTLRRDEKYNYTFVNEVKTGPRIWWFASVDNYKK